MRLFTIGYEAISYAELRETLKSNKIETVLDIRENPISRKAGFSKTALSLRLRLDGFEYDHLRQFGCPRHIRDEYKISHNWSAYTKSYKTHLANLESEIQGLAQRVKAERCVLFCFEAHPEYCHRNYVAHAVARTLDFELSVVHLSIETQTQAARRYLRLA